MQSFASPYLDNAVTVVGPVAGGKPNSIVIWLHGLGDTPDGWVDVAKQFSKTMPHTKFLLPTAPVAPVSLNFGIKMTSWYDIKGLDVAAEEDVDGMKRSAEYVLQLAEKQACENNLNLSNIAVVGFSQGAAVSLTLAACIVPEPLAGVVALSGYLPQWTVSSGALSPYCLKTPILQCHGDADQVVSHRWGQLSHEKLVELGAQSTFETFPGMGHGALPSELKLVLNFLSKQLEAV